MKITLEVLKEKGANKLDIQCFEEFCSIYIKKKECEPIELVKQGFDNGVLSAFRSSLVYRCIDTIQELRDVVDWQIKADWEGAEYRKTLCKTFEYCAEIYKQDLELFKKAVKHHFDNDFTLIDIFEYCGEVLALLPDLYEKLKELDKIWQNLADIKIAIRKTLKQKH